MKKLLVIFMAIAGLVSCAKDGPSSKSLYHNTSVVNDVTYEVNITNEGEEYAWTNVTRTDEVTLKYTFNYERKSDLQKDFASIVEGLDAIDGALIPIFTRTLRFTNDEEHDVVITREVEGGTVFVKFVVGPKIFKLPYNFIVEANTILNPKN